MADRPGQRGGVDPEGLPFALACRYSDDEPGSPWTWASASAIATRRVPRKRFDGLPVESSLLCEAWWMSVDSPEQLEALRRVGRVVAETLRVLRSAVAPGVSTADLDRCAAGVFAARGARSGPVMTYAYPGFICVSVEEEGVHGIPGIRTLRDGEVVSLDVAAELNGYHADAAITVPVGRVDDRRRRLMLATRSGLAAGIDAARPGATLKEVGASIEREIRRHGFEVFGQLTGHGIGLAMHEKPTVFNWAAPDATQRLWPGLVFTIEPMVSSGTTRIRVRQDGWTVQSADGSPSAHSEHTIMVTKGRPLVLTRA